MGNIDFDMTPERWESLLSHADVDFDDLRIAYMHGPLVIPTPEGPVLVIDTEKHLTQWDEYAKTR